MQAGSAANQGHIASTRGFSGMWPKKTERDFNDSQQPHPSVAKRSRARSCGRTCSMRAARAAAAALARCASCCSHACCAAAACLRPESLGVHEARVGRSPVQIFMGE